MNDIESLTLKINEILGRYVSIHDDIFKFSIRKLIPIPGIFKSINYHSHKTNLETLLTELSELNSFLEENNTHPNLVASDKEFLSVLHEYSIALLDTINRLYLIAEALCRKSEGSQDYSYDQYNSELAAYNLSVEQYTSLGERLNALFSQRMRM